MKSGWLVTSKELQKQISSTRNSYELDYFACKGIKWVIDHQDYVDDMKDKIYLSYCIRYSCRIPPVLTSTAPIACTFMDIDVSTR